MKQKNSAPLRRRTVVLAVGAALASLTVPALADPMLTIKLFRDSEVMFRDADMSRWADNYVELGVGYNSANSLRFGQFSGLTDKGGVPLAGFNWLSRDQGNDAQYWQIHGANLGLDSRKFQVQGGVQGNWDASFSFDGLKKSQTESAQFIHLGLGTNNLTLPAAGTALADPTAVPPALLQRFEIKHGRDIYRLGLKGLLGNEWDYKVNYREDHRDGTRLTGISFAAGGEAAIVPYQIDDKTQQIEAILSYTSKIAQLQLGYTYSSFTNSQRAFNIQNPFVALGATSNGRMSLAPSNDLHQINATGAYNFSKATRLSATYSYGIGRQNDQFLPYDTNLPNSATVLPRNSLEGKVVNTLLDVALTTKPIDKMNLKVAYQYRDNDNRTPISQYFYVGRDGTTAVPTLAAASASIRSNAPMSITEQKLSLEGDYEIAAKTVVRAGIEHVRKDYTKADVGSTDTDKLSLELRKTMADDFIASAGYSFTQRRGSAYDKNTFFRTSYTSPQQQVLTTGGSLTNHPSMRSYLFNDYDEHRARGSGNWTMSETVSLQGGVDRYERRAKDTGCNAIADPNVQAAINKTVADPSLKLPDTCLGQKLSDGSLLNLDLQWQPEENLTSFAFYNFGETRTKQAGRTWRTDVAAGADESFSAADTRRDWTGDSIYRDHTIGLGLKWQPEEKWDLGGTYVFNYGVGKTTIIQGAAPQLGASATDNAGVLTASTPIPNTWNKLHTLQLFAKWDYSKQLTWRFNYLYENLKSYDWALSDVGATSNTGVLFTGQQTPRYSNHVFGVSAVVKSW
jgi:MtrB/PioB family decaheme-associated outer membrane protein